MKIIHCADVHLGSQMKKFPKDKAEERARELRDSFSRLIEYARREGINSILLAGDVFDSDRPFKKDKEFFYSAVRRNADINFYYLRGNHDGKESYTETIDNLKTFGEEWTGYNLGENVCLYGLEMTSGNCESMYSSLKPEANNLNIVVLHGAVGESVGLYSISIPKLKNKNIDYLALGHYHSHYIKPLDGRGQFAYSGCLEGRGFDETGEKGFIVYDTDAKEARFVPFACRTVEEIDCDVSDASDGYGAAMKIRANLNVNPKNLLRVNLVGELGYIDENLAADVEKYLSGVCSYVSVKDRTSLKSDYSGFVDSRSLKGEFVRLALEENMDENDRQIILDLGLKALSGQADR